MLKPRCVEAILVNIGAGFEMLIKDLIKLMQSLQSDPEVLSVCFNK
jgi:hypothetical protein